MPEPTPIKNGCLQGGNPNLYGGRDAIKALVMGTRPEEFGHVADGYLATSRLLTTAITTLGDAAARLVADGNWGGESAKAMLTRMNRLQTYLMALRDAVDRVPPSLQTVSQALTSAKERFEQETAPHNYYAMGSGSPDNGDGRAKEFMTRLNSAFHNAHTALPDRLPWDAQLASPAPYLPPAERPATPVSGGDLPYEDTVPVRSATQLAQHSGGQATTAPQPYQPAGYQAAPGAQPPGGNLAASAQPPTVPAPAGTGQLSGLTPGQGPGQGQAGAAPGSVPGTTPAGGVPGSAAGVAGPYAGAGQPATAPPSLTPATPSARPGLKSPAGEPAHNPVVSPFRDPSTASAAQGAGPSVRPGSVPVVDGSWPATRPPATGAEPAAPGTAGAPFLPFGGAAPQESRPAGRATPARSADDDFFRPVIEAGPPVVG
ncbi:hypothetical protein BKM31_31545 [[Actinomadura] parvosata subsp. kistnae]|uniref:PPE family domain-containing protein n=1 Tax=[Actinomadura] parvosata subsp. kistnae TaxID=1909395 RepID=A0A1V0A590_9ACTN|nr:hypothetical protein [Nonomuraea sp. ATCC 55076]AQZ65385.1 hypothetical protein BKM31_31545 [Nonomuraea sp. ATCC 55076]